MAKIQELHFELLPNPRPSPDLAPNDYWLFEDLKRMLQEKGSGSIEEVIIETKVYFKTKDKSFHKKGIEVLRKPRNQYFALERVCLKD